MKLSYLLLPPIFLAVSIYAQDSTSPIQPTKQEVRRNLLTKIEEAANYYNSSYRIRALSKDHSITTSLTQQDIKPLLDKLASQVKWTDYVKKYRDTALRAIVHILYAPASAGIIIFDLPGEIEDKIRYGTFFLEKEDGLSNAPRAFRRPLNSLNLLTLPFALSFLLPGIPLAIAGNKLEELVPFASYNNENLYIAMKKFYNSLPTGISRHHKTHKHTHKKR